MTKEEEAYAKTLKESGVEMPEIEVKADEKEVDKKIETEDDPEDIEPKDDKATVEDDEEDDSDDEDKTKPEDDEDSEDKTVETPKKKRSIYDDLKDKKKEVKNERELREIAEKERDDLKVKLEAIENAKSPEDKKEATNELEAYAEKMGADPKALEELKTIFLKDFKNDTTLAERLEKFEKWEQDNAKVIAEAEFTTEFDESLPSIKEILPTANDAEIAKIKTKINEIAHTKGWEDKPLDYIAFKNKKVLTALISPKKKGLENKDSKEDGDVTIDSDFNMNADLTKMTPPQREKWEKQYRQLGKTDGLIKDGDGKLSIL